MSNKRILTPPHLTPPQRFSSFLFLLYQNKLGDSPLHAASAKGRLDCARLLIEAGANVHLKNREDKKPVDVGINPEVGALLRTTMAERGADEDYLDEEDGGEGEGEANE